MGLGQQQEEVPKRSAGSLGREGSWGKKRTGTLESSQEAKALEGRREIRFPDPQRSCRERYRENSGSRISEEQGPGTVGVQDVHEWNGGSSRVTFPDWRYPHFESEVLTGTGAPGWLSWLSVQLLISAQVMISWALC